MTWSPDLEAPRTIADLNGHRPDPQPAPEGATAWPGAPEES